MGTVSDGAGCHGDGSLILYELQVNRGRSGCHGDGRLISSSGKRCHPPPIYCSLVPNRKQRKAKAKQNEQKKQNQTKQTNAAQDGWTAAAEKYVMAGLGRLGRPTNYRLWLGSSFPKTTSVFVVFFFLMKSTLGIDVLFVFFPARRDRDGSRSSARGNAFSFSFFSLGKTRVWSIDIIFCCCSGPSSATATAFD